MTDKKPTIIVLSRNYSTGLSVIRSVGSAGYTVDLVASTHKAGNSLIAQSSKYVRNSVEVVSKKVKDGNDNVLLEEILKHAGKENEKPILFPADDYTTSVVDLNSDVLKEHFLMPHIVGGGQGSLTEHMDKTVQAQIAKKVGLLTPKEWIFSLKEEIEIPEDMVYPCFCKPIESVSGYKKEMAKCKDEFELKNHLKRLQRIYSNRSILVQEFLQIDNEIDISGVCLDQEIIIPAVIKKTKVAKYEKGVTLAGKLYPLDEIWEVKEKVIQMLKEFHYFGMFDMELNIVGDNIYFNEVNLRSGGPNYSYFKSGVNLPLIYVKEAAGERHLPEEERVSAYGKSFVYEKVAWEDYIYGKIDKATLDGYINEADIKILNDESDPVPGEIFEKKILEQYERQRRQKKKEERRKNFIKLARRVKNGLLGLPQTKAENKRSNNQTGKPRVLVTGRNYSSNLTIAKSLGEAGYEVEILRIFQKRPRLRNVLKMLKPDAYSKYIKAYRVCVSDRRSRRIVNRLKKIADKNEKMLIIPADDLMAYIVDDYYDTLKQYYYLPNVNDTEGAVNKLMSKGVQKELALKAGLPVLNSCVITTKEGNFEIPETVTYPCFIKPNISKNSSKSKMKKCYNEKELRSTLEKYSEKKDVEMLVEDFVKIKREYSILGLSTKAGAVGPGLFAAIEGGQNEHIGVAVVGQLLDPATMQPLVDNLINFVSTLKFDGLYDIDLVETEDGKIYFVELNMRYGASGYAVTKGGANLPGMFADYMIYGTPIDKECKVNNIGATFVSEKVLIEEYAMGRLSKQKLKSALNEADITFIKDKEDPQGYRHFKKFYKVATLKRLFKNRKNIADENASS